MKYKVGDKVRIKTWKKMEKEFGIKDEFINCQFHYTLDMEREVQRAHSDRIFVIEKINDDDDDDDDDRADYKITCNGGKSWSWNWFWSDDMVDYLVKDYKKPIIVLVSRFELMDFEL